MFAPFMVHAWEASSVVAVVAGVVGFFVVLRGASFAAHALPNGAFAGAAGASLIGVSTLLGLGAFSLLGAAVIAGLSRRARSDVATALAIVLMLGTGALFLSRTTEYAPEIFSLLFGEVLGVSTNELLPTAALAVAGVGAVAVLFRPLLLSTVAPETARARGVSPRTMDLCFLCVLALVTTMAVPVVGSLLVFTLLVSPAATSRCLASTPRWALALSVALALATVWAAIALSFETNLPVGFFVGAAGAVSYAAGRSVQAVRSGRPRAGAA